MSYSFFGTCFNDHNHLYDCLKTILNQTILPKEIILVNSGDANIEKKITNLIHQTRVKLIYIHVEHWVIKQFILFSLRLAGHPYI